MPTFNDLRCTSDWAELPQWLRQRLESCDSDVDRLSALVRVYALLSARHARFVQASNVFITTLAGED